ncbi:MAG TPA: periplasmic heavy metal sensor [Thermoanaerobaculia bacterium]
MRKSIVFSAAAIVLVALVAVPFAFAQRGRAMHAEGGFGGPMILGHLAHAKQALGLSDQQVSDIRAVFQDLRQQNEPYRASMRTTMQQVAQTLLNNPNDVAAAQALMDRQIDAERTMKTNALNAAAKALNVLTAEQRTKLSSMVQERMSRSVK